MVIKAVGFDFFGTLVDAQADWESCMLSMCRHLQQCGYEFPDDEFMAHYRSVVVECRRIRYEELREVNNCIWVADTLRRMGIEAEASSPDIISAVEKYFSRWQLSLVADAPEVLERLSGIFEIALISNFTHSPFLRQTLSVLRIDEFFDHVIDSDAVGWRKPHPNIFKYFLKLSRAKAKEAVFIGDDLETDIKGAKDLGIKAVLFARPGRIQNKQAKTEITPDHTVSSLSEFGELLLTSKI